MTLPTDQTTTAITLAEIEKNLTSPQVLAKFSAVLNERARPYIESLLTLVDARPDLQKCTTESLIYSALRAAQLQLSLDPAVKQAHIVPYLRRKKAGNEWRSYYEAVFQPHYLGLYTLAVRTGKYRTIDVLPTPAGYQLVHSLEHGEDVLLNEKGQPVVFMPKVKPEEAGGWYGYFTMRGGFTKKVYMTVQEIHAHGKKFSKSYDSDKSTWKDPNIRPTMEKKTVLLALLRWADLNGISDGSLHDALKAEEEVLDVEAEDAAPAATEALPSGTDKGVDETFPNGSKRLMELREKAKADPTTAYWEAAKAAGLDTEAGKSVLKECGGDFAVAFNKLATAYAEVIK